MLAEERLSRIVDIVRKNGNATVPELSAALDASESTIRRDLEKLDAANRLVKVHGGATAAEGAHLMRDLELSERYAMHAEEKRSIVAYAASLISPDDFVYVDAGTTVEGLIDCLTETRATFATDSVSHAMKLAAKGCHTIVLGGELKSATEALVGPDALDAIERYHFTLGFWGTNGATPEHGFTTPDRREAKVKQLSMEHTQRRFVLADASKLGATSLVTFAPFGSATVITDRVPDAYKHLDNIVEVGR